jgi:DNA polymerase-4
MPLRTAAKKCPDAVFLPVDAPIYEAMSARVMEVLRSLEVVVEVMGWDEAFLAVETVDPEGFAAKVQRAVFDATALHCSVGIGDNKLRAKIATDLGKPRGMFRLTADNWYEVMGQRPTEALWGIGKKTAKRLAARGISSVNELAAADPQTLAATLGPTLGPWYVRLGRGRDNSPVNGSPYVARGHSREVTFQHDLTDWSEIERELDRLAVQVADDVKSDGRPAIRVAIKVRYAPFDTRTRSLTLPEPASEVEALARAVRTLSARLDRSRAVRLLGVRAEMADAESSDQS